MIGKFGVSSSLRHLLTAVLLFSTTSIYAEDVFGPADAVDLALKSTFDPEGFVEIRSGENTAFNGIAHYSRVSVAADSVWLLEQRGSDMKEGDWERYAIVIRNKTAYFVSIDDGALFGEQCVSCHANGLRALRGSLRAGNPELLQQINEQVELQGLVKPYVPDFDPLPESSRLPCSPCVRCHNGTVRSHLYGFQAHAIDYQWLRGHMPPDIRMTDEELRLLNEWIMANR